MKVYKRVRKLPSGTVQEKWICDLGKVNGKRSVVYFSTEKEALKRLKAATAKKAQEGAAAFAMTEGERVRLQAAQADLARIGATVEEAVAFYLVHHEGVAAEITLLELLNECVLDKELAGKRPRYVTQFGVSCRSFIGAVRAEQLAHTVTRQEVQQWLDTGTRAAKTQRVYLGDVRSLFSWGKDRGYLAHNPAAGKFALRALDATEIHSLTAEQARRLLVAACEIPVWHARGAQRWERPPLLWYVVLGIFAGVRPEELARLDRGKVSLEERHVIVEGRSSKTRQRRVIDLSENAVEWLKLDPLREGPVRPVNWKLLFARLRGEAGWRSPAWTFRDGKRGAEKAVTATSARPVWPHDAMRHTFASMHYAMHQNERLLKAQMGHSQAEDTLMQHYRALTTRREAEAFWALLPN